MLIKFQWSLFLRVHLTMSQHYFIWWCVAEQVKHYLKLWWSIDSYYYLNQLLSRSLAHFSITSLNEFTHWGRVTHICVSNLTITGSDNGLSPVRCQAIIWTNAGILSIGSLGTNFSEILLRIETFSFTKMHLKMSSAKPQPFRLGLYVLIGYCRKAFRRRLPCEISCLPLTNLRQHVNCCILLCTCCDTFKVLSHFHGNCSSDYL